ncbi:transposable element Tcb2 transposase [Trichonephila clavipes]|nr:transposable element Tcb2 transposase [Trichonephila clavipes]
MNPIEHVWDALRRRVAGRQPPPQTLEELERALLEEWDRIPQLVINSLIDSMPQSIGRFPTIIVCYCITCISMFLALLSNSYSMFIILRLIQAFGRTGVSTVGYVLVYLNIPKTICAKNVGSSFVPTAIGLICSWGSQCNQDQVLQPMMIQLEHSQELKFQHHSDH